MRTNTKTRPAALVAYDKHAERVAARSDHEKRRAANKHRVRRYNAARFVRVAFDLPDFLRDCRCNRGDTLNDLQNQMDEIANDNAWSYFSDSELPDIADANAIIEYAHGTPRAYLLAHADDVRRDLKRAVVNAYAGDYAYSYFRWLRDSIESVCGDTGARWCWLDSKGDATAEDYDAPAVGFALTRAEYLKRDADWWTGRDAAYSWDHFDSERERIAAADEVLGDYLREAVYRSIDGIGFDERGCRGAETDDWPDHLANYSDTADTFYRADKVMRVKLRAMVRARAPLAERARLVATVYGVPGSVGGDA
jgi:hypothetical protein